MRPTIGRIVHYVLRDLDVPLHHQEQAGKHRPAVITEAWGNDKFPTFEGGSAVQLHVFLDHPNDGPVGQLWRGSVTYSESGEPGTWHWPERETE